PTATDPKPRRLYCSIMTPPPSRAPVAPGCLPPTTLWEVPCASQRRHNRTEVPPARVERRRRADSAGVQAPQEEGDVHAPACPCPAQGEPALVGAHRRRPHGRGHALGGGDLHRRGEGPGPRHRQPQPGDRVRRTARRLPHDPALAVASPVLSEAPVRGGRRFVVSGARDTHTCAHTCGELHGCKSTPVHTPVENCIGVIQGSSAYFASAGATTTTVTARVATTPTTVLRVRGAET